VVSQTAGEIVVSTGIFSAVKSAFGSLIQTLQTFQPQIIEGIKSLISFISANGPIIVGVIIGGLVPAFVALAASIVATMIPLLPFIAAGAVIGVMVQAVVDALGGWQVAQEKVNGVLTSLGELFNNFIKPSLDSLWAVIRDNLIPELKRLWDIVSPVLVPVLKVLGTVLGVTLKAAFWVIIEVLKLVIGWVADMIGRFNDMVDFFKGIPDAIRNAFSGVKNAITQPFEDAKNKVSQIAQDIKSKLDSINPYHRESPSLVDNVKSGVNLIKDQYASLKSIRLPSLNSLVPAFESGQAFSPAFAGAETSGGVSGGQQQNIDIQIGQVGSQQDVESLVRELGFMASNTPGVLQ
jgi:phage-related protein